jgi:restriction system protein
MTVRKVQIFEFKIHTQFNPITKTNLQTTFSPIYREFKFNTNQDISLINNVNDSLDIKRLVEREILKKKLLSINPYDFEELIADLVHHTGFIDVEVTKKSGDGGIDIKAKLENHFSTEVEFLFQVKRWRHSVGRADIANLRGSIGYNNFGVMISTSFFTKSAIIEAYEDSKKPINLIGLDLLHNIIDKTNYQIKI